MSNKRNDNLRMVDTNWDEIEERVRERRRRRLRLILIIVAVCAAAGISGYFIMQRMTYDDYTVVEEYDRSDTPATRYIAFGDGYVSYSNDGASYVTSDNATVWNQGYEMENPIVVSCGSYVAVADRQGETVYIMDEDGVQGEISLTMPVSKIDVASQGTVAVLMVEGGTGYISLFDKGGDQIAEGALHVENTGTPVDIALSSDGKNLAVSIVDVSSGTAGTTINFYNFSASGQNQIDNLVGTYSYGDTIVPELFYAGDGTLIAFADNGVFTFEGGASPTAGARIDVSEEIMGIFYDESRFGLAFANSQGDAGRQIHVYDTDCSEQTVIETDFTYDNIEFLDNHEVCIFNSDRCVIYTSDGMKKFDREFDEEIRDVFHVRGFRNYIFLKESTAERIRFTLALDSTELQALFGSRDAAEAEE